VCEQIFKDVDSQAKKHSREKAGESAERARESSQSDQGFRGTAIREVLQDSVAHGSLLRGTLESQLRFRELQKIQAAKDRRRKVFLQDAAASAAGIPSLNFTGSFDEHGAPASGIDAMPAFPGFHDHGPVPPFTKAVEMPAKAVQCRPLLILVSNICMSKYKSKGKFE
jgi:hypothetical protein